MLVDLDKLLRWKGTALFLGAFEVGRVDRESCPYENTYWAVLDENTGYPRAKTVGSFCATEAEARTAVETAVKEALAGGVADDRIEVLEQKVILLSASLWQAESDAERYNYLRDRDLEAIVEGGVFAGRVPQNVVLNGVDLDKAIDDAVRPRECSSRILKLSAEGGVSPKAEPQPENRICRTCAYAGYPAREDPCQKCACFPDLPNWQPIEDKS